MSKKSSTFAKFVKYQNKFNENGTFVSNKM